MISDWKREFFEKGIVQNNQSERQMRRIPSITCQTEVNVTDECVSEGMGDLKRF